MDVTTRQFKAKILRLASFDKINNNSKNYNCSGDICSTSFLFQICLSGRTAEMASRRTFLKAGAGLAALAAVPVGGHIYWQTKDFTRNGFDPAPPIAPDGETSWMNWSGIERSTPVDMLFPETEDELADVVRRAQAPIRPVGSGHSFTGLATSEGIMVDISAMEGLKRFDPETGQAVFGAGTRLFQAASQLDQHERAFANLPDIDVQTMAGSFATATHGTGNQLSALHDAVTAFRLITPSGDILDVSASSHPDLFAAGRVSLGALGIITEYTINTVPAFNLHRRMHVEKVEPFLERMEELGETHRNFEFFYLTGTGMVAWLTHDLFEGEIEGRGESQDDDTLDAMKALRDSFGWFPWLRRKIAQTAIPTGEVENFTDESWALLSTTRPVRFVEMEYHIPREAALATVRQVIRKLDQTSEAFFPMEFRNVAADTAWLSPFSDGPKSSIAIHAGVDERYDYFFSEFEPIYRAVGGHPHWGKLHSLGKADFLSLYPRFADFLDIRKTLDSTGKFLNPHLAHIFGETFNG